MNLAEYALNNRALVKFLIAVLVVGGIFSFVSMSKLEDPEIKVKQALVVTVYPGASAHKVELEVTDVLEKEIRAMGDIASVESKWLICLLLRSSWRVRFPLPNWNKSGISYGGG